MTAESPRPLLERLKARLWAEPALPAGGPGRWLMLVGRYGFAILRDLSEGQLSLRAISLVYTTLLSIVPLLALGFSVLKALGANDSLTPVLEEFLRPLGPQAATLSVRVVAFVEKIQVGVLGSLGVALLFYTAVSLIRQVETSFNVIWRIDRTRPLAQRIGEYLGVLMVGPVLVFSALGLTASVLNSAFMTGLAAIEPFGELIYVATRLIPYVIIVGLFAFMYGFLVSARVSWRAALTGGLAAGVLWQTSSVAFASFVANASNYNAIYSSFAILIFLLIWLHVGWLILLVGCQLAFYVQNPRHLEPRAGESRLHPRDQEFLSLMIMTLVAERFLAGEPGPTEPDLLDAIDAPPEHVTHVIQLLLDADLLTEAGTARRHLLPTRDLASVGLGEFWARIRRGPLAPRLRDPLAQRVSALLDEAEAPFRQQVRERSLRDWAAPAPPPG